MDFHDIDRVETLFDHLYFIPEGQVVPNGGTPVTVAKNVWPDTTPSENYDAFKLKEIENLKPFQTPETESRTFVSETTAGWTQEDETTIKNRGFTFDTGRTNAFYKMLEKGLAVMPVFGEAAVPGEDKRAYRDGVLLHETGVVSLKAITEREQVWARIELVNPGDHTNKTAKIQLKITILDADNNTFEMPTLA